jgi:hypothetical protein
MIITHGLNNFMKHNSSERGIALLITLLIMTVLLGVSASMLNITLKQFQFASIGLASEIAFQSANAGMECMLSHDYEGYPPTPAAPGKFDIGQPDTNITCMTVSDSPTVTSGTDSVRRDYEFSWGSNPTVCTDVSIYKFYNATNPVDMTNALRRSGTCAAGVSCTVIQSRGYNVACASINNPRTIERELTQRY